MLDRKNTLYLIFVFMILLGSNKMSAQCVSPVDTVPSPTWFNTGNDGHGSTIPQGSNDLHWQWSQTLTGTYTPAFVVVNPTVSYIASPWPNCAWIAHSPSGDQATEGFFYYKITFDLPCQDACGNSYNDDSTFCLTLDFYADNSVYEIYVNGVPQSPNLGGIIPVANPYSYIGFQGGGVMTATLCKDWQAGVNTLIVQVASGPPQEAFLAQAHVNTGPTPVPVTSHFETSSGVSDGGIDSACAPFTVNFQNQSTGANKYNWDFGDGSPINNSENPNHTFTNPGTYTVKLLSYNDTVCSTSDSSFITIKVNPPPSFTLSSTNPTTCSSADGTITMSGLTPNTNYNITYNGVGPTAMMSNGSGNITITGLPAGTYINFTVETESGCSTTNDSSLTLNTPATPTVNAGNDTTICEGENATLTAIATPSTATISWDNGVTNGTPFSPTTTTVYTATATANGCTATDQMTVIVDDKIQPLFEPIEAFCSGTSAPTLPTSSTNSPAITGTWSPSTVSNTSSGNYVFTPSAGECAKDTTINIIVNPLPTFTLSSTNPTTCSSNDGTITINGLNLNTSYTVTYNDNGTQVGPSSMTSDGTGKILINALSAGTYDGFIVSDGNCDSADNSPIQLVSPAAPTVNAGNDTAICEGQSATLTATASPSTATISWDNGVTNGLPFSPTITTTYTVTVSANGCVATDQIKVTVNPNPTAIINSNSPVCEGTTLTLSTSNEAAYNWTGPNGFTSNQQNPHIANATPAASGTYTLVVTDANGCTNQAVAVATIAPNPTVNFIGDSLSGCTPWCVTLIDTSTILSGNITSLQWDLGDGRIESGNQIIACYDNEGLGVNQYAIKLVATSDKGCKDSLTKVDYINIYPQPKAAFTMNPKIGDIDHPNIHFIDESQGANGWKWDFGDGGTSTMENPMHSYNDTGSYLVDLNITNQWGCKDSTFDFVKINPVFSLYIPNAFTPNGDGKNDTFHPVGYGIKSMTMYVFNRWGELIYSGKGVNAKWTGIYENELVPPGVYVYKIEAKDYLNHNHSFIGHVTIVK